MKEITKRRILNYLVITISLFCIAGSNFTGGGCDNGYMEYYYWKDDDSSGIYDLDGDGIVDNQDFDMDGDGIFDWEDNDIDNDLLLNGKDGDLDGDGVENDQDFDADADNLVWLEKVIDPKKGHVSTIKRTDPDEYSSYAPFGTVISANELRTFAMAAPPEWTTGTLSYDDHIPLSDIHQEISKEEIIPQLLEVTGFKVVPNDDPATATFFSENKMLSYELFVSYHLILGDSTTTPVQMLSTVTQEAILNQTVQTNNLESLGNMYDTLSINKNLYPILPGYAQFNKDYKRQDAPVLVLTAEIVLEGVTLSSRTFNLNMIIQGEGRVPAIFDF